MGTVEEKKKRQESRLIAPCRRKERKQRRNVKLKTHVLATEQNQSKVKQPEIQEAHRDLL